MSGELTPVVMLPRYSTYAAGASPQDFTTIAMDVTEYQNAILNVWRAALVGSGSGTAAFLIFFEESTDQVTWFACSGPSSSGEDPGSNTEAQYTAALKRRWFRVRIRLTDSGSPAKATATCWCVGFLEERLR